MMIALVDLPTDPGDLIKLNVPLYQSPMVVNQVYDPSKPVRVVSTTGLQQVQKSFTTSSKKYIRGVYVHGTSLFLIGEDSTTFYGLGEGDYTRSDSTMLTDKRVDSEDNKVYWLDEFRATPFLILGSENHAKKFVVVDRSSAVMSPSWQYGHTSNLGIVSAKAPATNEFLFSEQDTKVLRKGDKSGSSTVTRSWTFTLATEFLNQ